MAGNNLLKDRIKNLSTALGGKNVQEKGNQGVKESQLIMRLLQELAEGEAVARGNRASAMEALDSGAKMSDLDMDAINMALGRGVTKSIRPRARPQGMMYGGEVKKGKVKKYKGGGCVMAGRGGNFKGVK
jgi:phage-related baseplate assembly protein